MMVLLHHSNEKMLSKVISTGTEDFSRNTHKSTKGNRRLNNYTHQAPSIQSSSLTNIIILTAKTIKDRGRRKIVYQIWNLVDLLEQC